jgi:hypothetical protein
LPPTPTSSSLTLRSPPVSSLVSRKVTASHWIGLTILRFCEVVVWFWEKVVVSVMAGGS